MRIRHALSNELDAVVRFYASLRHAIRLRPTCKFLVANDDSGLVGAVRLCDEHGHLVLRTMRVAPTHQREGLGTQMLQAVVPLMESRPCYCIPYDHLTSFYSQIGFRELSAEEAPDHVQVRLRKSLGREEKVVVISRVAYPRATSSWTTVIERG